MSNNHKHAVNFILNCDSYKNDHGRMLKPGVKYFESNIIARKATEHTTHVTSFGMQMFLKAYMVGVQITKEVIDEAEIEITEQGYEFDRARWEYIVEKYNGKIPLRIRALPDGTVVPVGVPLVRVFNTDENVAWLVGYIETMIQRGIWFPSTVATIARSLKEFLSETMMRHAGHKNVQYHLHNFGDRGATCYEAAVLAGTSHAVYFSGSDSLSSNLFIKRMYNITRPVLSSVLASEHSVTCSNSDAEKRDDFNMALKMVRLLEDQIRHVNKTGKGLKIVSVVADTYDIFRFCREFIGTRLRETLKELGERGGRLVIRPDSGDPTKIPVQIVGILMDCFGYTVNENGMKVLPPYIGVLQGDGINETSIREIVKNMDEHQYSIENLLFGMGGKLVHPVNGRDNMSFAMKGSAQSDAGIVWEDLFKDPITDVGKRSLRGRVTTYRCKESNNIIAERVELQDVNPFLEDMMIDVFDHGELLNECTFDEVQELANAGI